MLYPLLPLLLFPLSSREFAKEKDRVESRAGFLLLKEEQKLEREMNGYMNWICKAGKIRNGKNQSNVIHRVSILCPRQVLDQVLYDPKLAWTPCSLSRELQLIYTKLF